MSGKHELAWSEGQEMRSILQNGYLSFLLRIFFERVLAVCSSSQSKQTMKFVVENLGWVWILDLFEGSRFFHFNSGNLPLITLVGIEQIHIDELSALRYGMKQRVFE